jgi:hypothetical protein
MTDVDYALLASDQYKAAVLTGDDAGDLILEESLGREVVQGLVERDVLGH